MSRCLLLLIASWACAADLLVVTGLAAEPKVTKDVPYAEPATVRRTLDVYSPSEGAKHPVVVWIHGGGWKRGDKSSVQRKPQAFVDRGFVFVSINYRFVPEVTIQQMTGDVAKAIRWVREHAKEYGGDGESIFVMGHSAGAHLAALVSTDERYLKAEGLSLAALKGCVPVDVSMYDAAPQIKWLEENAPARVPLFTSTFGDEASQIELSPIKYIAEGKSIPPFLILCCASRPDASSQSAKFGAALAKAGVAAAVFAAEGKDHGSINSELGVADDPPTVALDKFLNGILKR